MCQNIADEADQYGLENNNVSIEISGAYKSYDETGLVLNNFCMTVEHNTIYALLGASGCGKTTLLSCIVNRLELDSGSISLSISTKRLLGYMPQQMALYQEFSIQEMFQYFGILYSMVQEEIDQMLKSLTMLLSLPDKDSLCGRLSGGQQRRVSVAVTLMHSPKLLILDEPTAGIDPLISESIWKHLIHLSTTGVTTIITTHYIDEAKHAHKIGLMRNGVILEEGSPSSLLTKFNTQSLEDVFLALSEQQQQRKSDNTVVKKSPLENDLKTKRVQRLYHADKAVVSASHMRCQMYKYFNWAKRNLVIALFIVLLPGVSVELFNLSFQNLPQLSLGVINADTNCTQIQARMGCETNSTGLSCYFLKTISNGKWHLNYTVYDSYDTALVHFKQNKIHGILEIPVNFSEGLITKLNEGMHVDKELLASSFVTASFNRGDFIRSHQMEDGLVRSFQLFYKNFITDCLLDDRLSRIPPIKFETPIFGKRDPEFVQFISTGLIVQISFCFPILFSVTSLIAERLLGLMERSLVAGLTVLEVVMAHSVISLCMVMSQSVLSMTFQYWFWGHPFHGSVLLGFLLLISEGVCGTFLGFLVALSAKSFIPGAIIVGTLNTIVLLFCGYIWPLEGMPPILRYLSYFFPPTTGIQAMRAIIWKSYPIYHRHVLAGFLPPIIWTGLFLINIAYFARRKYMY